MVKHQLVSVFLRGDWEKCYHKEQGKVSILTEAAEKVVNKYKGNYLWRYSRGNPKKLYCYVYHQLSTEIHK